MAKITNTSPFTYRGRGHVIEAGVTAEVTDEESEYLLSVFGDRFTRAGEADPPKQEPKRKQIRGPRRKRA